MNYNEAMTNSKHTPGPWKLTERGLHRQDIIATKYDPEEGDYEGVIATTAEVYGREYEATNLANARLIAAAPALLAACEAMIREMDTTAVGWETDWKTQEQMRAAIALAGGTVSKQQTTE